MTKLRLCIGKRATTPYFIKSICVNVYSLEEICYIFALNPFMINAEIMDYDLIDWFEKECELPELSLKLRALLRKGLQLGEFVNIILDYGHFCDDMEREVINETLKSNSGLNDFERRKNQADYLTKNGKYEMAIEEYEALLSLLPDVESDLRPRIYQNMGYAYAKLFMFDVAAKYLRRAYDMTKDKEKAIMYLCAVRMYMPEDKYINFISERGELSEVSMLLENKLKNVLGDFEGSSENIMLNALSIYKDEGNVASYYDEIDKVIAGMKEDYSKQVTA